MDESKQAYPAQAEAQEDASRVEARRQREKKKRENLRFAIELVAVVLAALLIRHYVFMLTIVSGSSMEETCMTTRSWPWTGSAMRWPTPSAAISSYAITPTIPRTMSSASWPLPATGCKSRTASAFLNGQALQEEYIVYKAYSDFGPYQVPEGCVFVMGDNRANSHDSRAEGALPLDLLEGRVFAVLYPLRPAAPGGRAAQQEGG